MATDKALHLIVGFAIAIVFGFMTGHPEIGAGIAFLIGVAKEMWDFEHPKTHQVEFLDAFVTAIGGGFGCAVLYMWDGWRAWEVMTPFG